MNSSASQSPPPSAVWCDESSIPKSFDGATRRRSPSSCAASIPAVGETAAPNDYTELGTSSEALGGLGHMDMLSRFFIARIRN